MKRLLRPCPAVVLLLLSATAPLAAQSPPNLLLAISDDQSFPHASAYGAPGISTPGFDQVARQGMLFHNAFVNSPGCSPSRAALLTGRHPWQLGAAGTHASAFAADLPVFPEVLEQAGYFVGMTGKGWGPGNWQISGRERNPAGPGFNRHRHETPPGVSPNDYSANFAQFLDQRPGDQPFCFWFGASEPHRPYDPGLGRRAGIDPGSIRVPEYLPDHPEVREDLADYFAEIQWFDAHLVRMLEALAEAGELDNTLVIVTSDNGMPFPRAKANLYEDGVHVPLAISWPGRFAGQQQTNHPVSWVDLTATIVDLTGIAMPELSGTSLVGRLSEGSGAEGEAAEEEAAEEEAAVFFGRERHSSSRFNTLGYPQRGVRTASHLLIHNLEPQRWPAGAPQRYTEVRYDAEGEVVEAQLGPPHGAYHDIDDCPTLQRLIAGRNDPQIAPYLALAVDRRPEFELFDVRRDPACLNNLADDPQHAEVFEQLRRRLHERLVADGDPRITQAEGGDLWEQYPRYSPLRWFPVPAWAQQPSAAVPHLPWLEERRPR